MNTKLLILAEEDDVPPLVKDIVYKANKMHLHVTFFNDKEMTFANEMLGNVLKPMQFGVTEMQWLQIENEINKLAKKEWHEWCLWWEENEY